MTEGVVLGVSGWFTPHGILYHEEGRTIFKIAAEDWSKLLAHADEIAFFTRSDPPLPAPDAPFSISPSPPATGRASWRSTTRSRHPSSPC